MPMAQASTPEQFGEHGVPCFAIDLSAFATKLFDKWPPKRESLLANWAAAQCARFRVRLTNVLQASFEAQAAVDFFVCADRWAK
jgi:hypothetical protein